MRSGCRGAGVVTLALLSGWLWSGCASTSVVPGPTPPREPGSYLARTLAERASPAPTREPKRVAARPTAPFHSPYGHAIAQPPTVSAQRSIGGRDLRYWVIGDGPETVLLLGGIHGDEQSATEAAYDFLAWVVGHPDLLTGRRLVIAPEVNPDGRVANSRRNQHDVDLNRNFPASNWRWDNGRHGPGAHPGSEPETRFVLALLAEFRPDRVIATHAAAACVNWDGPAEQLAYRMSRECGLPSKSSIGYPTPGSLGSYLGIDRDVPTITLELETKGAVGSPVDGVRRALLAAVHYPQAAPRLTDARDERVER